MTKSSGVSTELVLRAQPDKGEAVGLIAKLLQKIAMLWQIPNFTPQNSVLLAEWIFDNYQCEPLEVIVQCLQNPPIELLEEKTWRLTPDVITIWMKPFLEKQAAELEKNNQELKQEFKDKLPEINYESFKKRLAEGKALNDNKPQHWKDDPGYKAFKDERIKQSVQPRKTDEQKPK